MKLIYTNLFSSFRSSVFTALLIACFGFVFSTNQASAQTTCTYTIDLMDSFGDGWNGNILVLTNNGVTEEYTFTTGSAASFEAEYEQNSVIKIGFIGGSFQNEVTYNIIDPDGNIVFSDGPNPALGDNVGVFSACATCDVLDVDPLVLTDVTAGSATIDWTSMDNASNYIIEWGPVGFELGTGTTITTDQTSIIIDGLDENSIYEIYIAADCDGDGESGFYCPFAFQTEFAVLPQGCNYTLELYAADGNAWGGSFITVTTNVFNIADYTLNNIDDDGAFAAFPISVLEGTSIQLGYTDIGFNDADISYRLLDPDGVEVFADGPFPIISDNTFEGTTNCPDCLAVDASSIVETDLVFDGVTITWNPTDSAMSYTLEYGPEGFLPGDGTSIMTTDPTVTITGLDEITFYDYYIIVDCGSAGSSIALGPFTIFTPFQFPPQTCTYILNLFDSFGDGWNGNSLTITHNAVSTQYTLDNINDNGDDASFDIDVFEGVPIIISYDNSGAFQNEVTYELINPDNLVEFSDGPNPLAGEVYSEVANCPDCSIMDLDDVTITNITFESAVANWVVNDSAQTYIIEFGPTGFIPGTGTEIITSDLNTIISGLAENTLYDVYITSDCGDGEFSTTAGPVTFQTAFIDPPKMCTYSLELENTNGTAWGGSFITITINGISTNYTLDNVNDDGTFQAFDVPVLQGFPIVMSYTDIGFNDFFLAFRLKDSDGIVLYEDEQSPTPGDPVYEGVATCPDCPATPPNNVNVLIVTDSTVTISFVPVADADQYLIEYGPAGFPLGFGVVDTANITVFQITGLNQCVDYEFYVTVDCGGDGVSTTVGPYAFTTSYTPVIAGPGGTCDYSLELFDSFGFGWTTGHNVAIEQNGTTNTYTVDGINDDGSFAQFDLTLEANLPVTVTYNATFSDFDNSYDLYDPDGILIFADGPGPEIGEVFEFLACPTCPPALEAEIYDINATNAILAWTNASNASGTYNIEWGTLGFTLGTGMTGTASSDDTMFILTGLEENTYYDVYIRLDCTDELSKPIGPLTFQTLFLVDVGVGGIFNPSDESCNIDPTEKLTIGLQNFGQSPQSLFEYHFAVNGDEIPVPIPSDGFFTGVVGNDSLVMVDFETIYDFSAPGTYIIEAWTVLEGDSDTSNDTFRLEISTAFPLPLIEGFEDGEFPLEWTTDEFNPIFAPGAHNNATFVAGDNIFSADPLFELTTLRVGPLNENDTLTFDYRYVNFFPGTVATNLSEGDSLIVEISDDCGETWTPELVIDISNHTPAVDMTNRFVDLAPYAGAAINVRFRGIWGSGDYWLDLDNINIISCPQNLGVFADVANPVNDGTLGSISVEPAFGTAPYFYQWDVAGATTSLVNNLQPGTYSVTITDAFGCVDIKTYDLELIVDDEEIPLALSKVTLSPNPTADYANLEVDIRGIADLEVQLFNIDGKILYHKEEKQSDSANYQFDMTAYPAGMYFVRVVVNGEAHYEKLMLAK